MAILLLMTFIAMLLTDEVNWSIIDFLVMGLMLIIAANGITLAIMKIKHHKIKNITSALIAVTFLLIWAELGVGLLGTPFAGN